MQKMEENNTEIMNIVFSSDKNYTELMGVSLCSIFENKKGDYHINVYVLDGGILKKDKKRLEVLEEIYDFKIRYIEMDTVFFKNFSVNMHYTQAVYYRIITPKILPNIKKILYLDCDLIILDDLYELYNTDIGNYPYGAVEDLFLAKTRNEELGIHKDGKYFNSGVLLMNIDKCNELNTDEIILQFIRKNVDKLKYVDQDALNVTMLNKIFPLEHKYNYFPFLADNKELNESEIKNNVKIIHYAGRKPWNYFDKNIFIQKYFYYSNKTPWKYFKKINYWKERKRNFLIKISSNIEKKMLYAFSGKNIERIKKLKRKLGIKLY